MKAPDAVLPPPDGPWGMPARAILRPGLLPEGPAAERGASQRAWGFQMGLMRLSNANGVRLQLLIRNC